MQSKILINKLKDNAELAQAAYGYYDLMTTDANQLFIILKDEYGKNKTDSSGNFVTKEITLVDIMNITFNGYEVCHIDSRTNKLNVINKLKGDFAPLQAKNFFEKYDLLDFYPKFDNKNNKQQKGFHACLFQDKESKEYTLAIRGSFDSKDYMEADFWNLFMKSSVPKKYYEDMIKFYYECAEKYPDIKKPQSLNITGHSLGGCLAQLFALSFARYDTGDRGIIHEVYTYNSPGARKLKPYENKDMRALYPQAYENLMANYYFHKDKNEGIDIGIPTYHIETRHNEKANKYYIGSPIALLGEDIAGLYVMVNNKKSYLKHEFWTYLEAHAITHLTRYLYLFEYLLSPINQNGQWNWDIDNLNRFINMIYSSNKEAYEKIKDDSQRSKKEKDIFKTWRKTPLLSILSDIVFITRDSLFQCEIFAKGFYENTQVRDMLQEEYAIDRFFLFKRHNVELKMFSFYRDISLFDKTLMPDRPSIFYSLYAFKPYEVYKDNKPYITQQNIHLIFSYNSDFAKCFYNENNMPSIDLMQGIESAYTKYFTLLWDNPHSPHEQNRFINLHPYSTKASYILVRE